MTDLLELADAIDAVQAEAMDWAKGNQGPGAQEIFVAQVAVSGTLKMLAAEIRSRASMKDKTNG